MKKFFFSNSYRTGNIISDWSVRTESIFGFILFFIIPIIGLIWYNASCYEELTILYKDKIVMDSLDVQLPKIDSMEDSIGLNIANSLLDSLDKVVIIAKPKQIKKHNGFWYTDTKTDIKTDHDCVSACKSEFRYDDATKTACLSKCIRINKIYVDEYVSTWYDTVWTEGIKLKPGVNRETYIKYIAVQQAKTKAKQIIDSIKTHLIKTSNLQSSEYRIISYDTYSKKYIDTQFENAYVMNIMLLIILFVYFVCLIIRQFKCKAAEKQAIEYEKIHINYCKTVLLPEMQTYLYNHGLEMNDCEQMNFDTAFKKLLELNLVDEFKKTLTGDHLDRLKDALKQL